MEINIQTERLYTKLPLCFTGTSSEALEFALCFQKYSGSYKASPSTGWEKKPQLLEPSETG